ncbi:MAG: type II toxin-antitoxin system YafQ family toxin [Candidatus Babeliales bacterium]|nr:type II toxin-antitoxin system YafQ family toxin [Candidatus Babeliales bacterium]
MLELVHEGSFIQDAKKTKKRGKDMTKVTKIIKLLLAQEPLPAKNKNHKLKGKYNGNWECHVEPDLLLVYKKTPTEIILVNLGTHADLFG